MERKGEERRGEERGGALITFPTTPTLYRKFAPGWQLRIFTGLSAAAGTGPEGRSSAPLRPGPDRLGVPSDHIITATDSANQGQLASDPKVTRRAAGRRPEGHQWVPDFDIIGAIT
eukprot:749361-Hanusia_phi.AAC.1